MEVIEEATIEETTMQRGDNTMAPEMQFEATLVEDQLAPGGAKKKKKKKKKVAKRAEDEEDEALYTQ